MSTVLPAVEETSLTLHFGPVLQKMNDHEFFEFCQLNRDWRFERTHEGDLVIMSPTGGKTGQRNFLLTTLFGGWVEADGTGVGFDSSTGFTLPNGAKRSPDLAWIKRSRWEVLTEDQRAEFPPLCPDFVVELRSPSDALAPLQAKMQEYMDNGAQLGWLIDPEDRRVHIYRPGVPTTCLDNPDSLDGEPLLPGLRLPVAKLWGEE